MLQQSLWSSPVCEASEGREVGAGWDSGGRQADGWAGGQAGRQRDQAGGVEREYREHVSRWTEVSQERGGNRLSAVSSQREAET